MNRCSQQRRTLLGSTLPLFLLLCSLSCAKPPDKPHPAPKKTPVTKKTAKIVAEDGPTTLDPGSNLVNGYSALTANVTAGATSLTVDDVSDLAVPGLGPLAAGDLILIYQPQGAAISTLDGPDYGAVTELGSSGRYELVEVNDVSGDTIGLSCATQSAYSSTGNAQVVRVPQYSTLTIPAGATLTGSAWDGSAGGVVAVHAESLVLDGSIDASALGFRGGAVDNMSTAGATNTTSYVATQQTAGGQKGESIAGSPSFYQNDLNGAYGRGAPANAGGGGNAHNAGGGGGAGANNGAIWTGQGVMLSSVVGPEAWLLDPGFLANGGSLTTSSGGGRGGYTYASDNENALLVAPESAAWGGNLRRERGGLGGHPLDPEVDGRLFFGGGGGAGDGNNGGAGAGGRGGGLVIVIAGSISGAGSIVASGSAGGNTTAGHNDGPGGGGGGGAIVVDAQSLSGISATAAGGAGGNQLITGNESEGPGGGGGGGFVAYRGGTITVSVAGALGGTSTSAGVTEFPSNGATAGAAGLVLANFTEALPVCFDTLAPDTTIESAPSDPSNESEGSFTFSSDDANASFECSLDGAAFSACPANFDTGDLSDGEHTLEVRAVDTIGNVDATPATHTWTIDTQAPDTTLLTTPSDPTSDTTGEFEFGSDEAGVGFECSLDGAGFSPCPQSFTTPTLGLGPHTLEVRAIDAAGNVDPTPATHDWEVVASPDEDDDGLSEEEEDDLGTDPLDADSDDDGVLDGDEPPGDADGDGLVNALDPDSDNDGLLDGTELGLGCNNPDTDPRICVPDTGDGGYETTDPLDADTDDGGVTDGSEDIDLNGGVNGDETDPTLGNGADDVDVSDRDGDGLSDGLEETIGSDPDDADSDDDGVIDGDEPNPSLDSDGDGLRNVNDADSDNDGLYDGTEMGRGCDDPATDASRNRCIADADAGATTTSPLLPDTDGGGVRDGSEDTNRNGVVDGDETDPTAGNGADDGAVTDTDGDGLSDELEDTLGSDPDDADSDDDGLLDGDEPNPGDDDDGDGDANINDSDSDGDGLKDGTEAGRDCTAQATDASTNQCVPDGDSGATTTGVLDPDTDDGGVPDGDEDADRDGVVDAGERDPNDPSDDDDMPDGSAGAAGDTATDAGTGGTSTTSGETGGTGGATSGEAGAAGSPMTGGTGGTGGSDGSGGSGGGGGSSTATGGSGGSVGSGGSGVSRPDSGGVIEGGGCACTLPGSARSPRHQELLLLLLGLTLCSRRRWSKASGDGRRE